MEYFKMNLDQFKGELLDFITQENKSDNCVILTGEKNLKIKREDLIDKVKQNTYGEEYLEVMSTESSIFVGQVS